MRSNRRSSGVVLAVVAILVLGPAGAWGQDWLPGETIRYGYEKPNDVLFFLAYSDTEGVTLDARLCSAEDRVRANVAPGEMCLSSPIPYELACGQEYFIWVVQRNGTAWSSTHKRQLWSCGCLDTTGDNVVGVLDFSGALAAGHFQKYGMRWFSGLRSVFGQTCLP